VKTWFCINNEFLLAKIVILNFCKINHKAELCFLEKNQKDTIKGSSLVSVLIFSVTANSLGKKPVTEVVEVSLILVFHNL